MNIIFLLFYVVCIGRLHAAGAAPATTAALAEAAAIAVQFDPEATEAITLETFGDLIEESKKANKPFYLAVLPAGRGVYSFFDGDSLTDALAKKLESPTRAPITKIFIYKYNPQSTSKRFPFKYVSMTTKDQLVRTPPDELTELLYKTKWGAFLGKTRDELLEIMETNKYVLTFPGYSTWYSEHINDTNRAEFVKVLERLSPHLRGMPLYGRVRLLSAKERLSSDFVHDLDSDLRAIIDDSNNLHTDILQAKYLLAVLYATRMERLPWARRILAEIISLENTSPGGDLIRRLIPLAQELLVKVNAAIQAQPKFFLGMTRDQLLEIIETNKYVILSPRYKTWYTDNINDSNKAEFSKALDSLLDFIARNLENIDFTTRYQTSARIQLLRAQQHFFIADPDELLAELLAVNMEFLAEQGDKLQAQYLAALLYATRLHKVTAARYFLENIIAALAASNSKSSLDRQLTIEAQELLAKIAPDRSWTTMGLQWANKVLEHVALAR